MKAKPVPSPARPPGKSHPNTLWIGGDLEGALPALNVNRAGKILRTLETAAYSLAVDPLGNRIYCNDGYYSLSTSRLDSLAAVPGVAAITPVFPGDMTFAGKLWIANHTDKSLDWIDPLTGQVGREIQLPFSPRGIAYDGSGFWLTAMEDDDHLVRVTGAVAACPSDETESCELGQVEIDLDLEFPVFGVAWDATDGTLWVGSKGSVVHLTTSGVRLGAFEIADGRFAGALEFQSSTGLAK